MSKQYDMKQWELKRRKQIKKYGSLQYSKQHKLITAKKKGFKPSKIIEVDPLIDKVIAHIKIPKTFRIRNKWTTNQRKIMQKIFNKSKRKIEERNKTVTENLIKFREQQKLSGLRIRKLTSEEIEGTNVSEIIKRFYGVK